MSDSLKQLIFNLSKREINYFTKFSKISKNEPVFDYISLYEKILGNEKKKVKTSSKNLSLQKNKLFDKLLQTVVNFNFDKNYTWIILKNLLYIRVLIEKGICQKASKIIEETKKLAYKYEEFDFILSIISLEESLCFNHCFIFDYNKLKDLNDEREKINKIINNIKILLIIKAELQQYQFIEGTYHFEIEDFIEKFGHSPYMPENEILSVRAMSIWLYIQSICSFINHDFLGDYNYHTRQYKLFKKYPEFFSRDEYLQLINNYLYCCSITKNENMFNTLSNELSKIKRLTKDEDEYIQTMQYLRKLELLHQVEKFKEADNLAKEVENFISIRKSVQNYYMIRHLQLLIIRAFIENNNFLAAIKISQKKYIAISYEFNCSMFKLFEFIAHYKLNNFDNLIYSVDSWVKTIRSKRTQFPIEKALIKFFRSVCNKGTLKEKKMLISNTIIQLKEIEKTNLKFYLNHIFDFTEWFEKELEEMK